MEKKRVEDEEKFMRENQLFDTEGKVMDRETFAAKYALALSKIKQRE